MMKFITVQLLFVLTVFCFGQARAWNNSGQAFSIWPDTGQTTCYDEAGNVLNPCPTAGQPFYGQDAQYYGPARSYTKLDSSGNGLPESATTWVMVRDIVTGLIWEVKQNRDGSQDYANPHDADNTYFWCDTNPDTNGSDQGTCGSNDTEDFLAALNGSAFGGHTDWRLPTIKELKTLVDRSRIAPSINTTYFPDTKRYYWSSTTYAGSTFDTWFVHFGLGYGNRSNKANVYYVRAVRGGQVPSENNRLVVNTTTVNDTVTCLEWQRATADITGDGVGDLMNWQDALAYAENLSLGGHDDWRLPDYNELTSIVDYSRYNPAIDITAFPDTVGSYYWSSTTFAYNTYYAWFVGFGGGTDHYYYKSYSCYVRAVRGRQCGSFFAPPPPPPGAENIPNLVNFLLGKGEDR